MFQAQPRESSTPTSISGSSSSSVQHELEKHGVSSDRPKMDPSERMCYDTYFKETPVASNSLPCNGMTAFDRIFEDQRENIVISHPNYHPFEFNNLDENLAENLRRMNHHRLLPMQAYAISVILDHAKLVVRAPTGSGKTAAFLIPAIQHVIDYHKKYTRRTEHPLVLILGNTQNLMDQTFKFACAMAGYEPDTRASRTQVRILDLFGGGSGLYRLNRLSASIEHEIVVATCGGVLQACRFEKLNLSELELLIIDEADKMTDSLRGFGFEVSEILSRIPDETRQRLQVVELSATFCEEDNNVVLSSLEKELFGWKVKKKRDNARGPISAIPYPSRDRIFMKGE
ncbi:hypothetical protein GCK32_004091 [Trichostrongylus colubriformis]|uniref:Helicase ATP-binding domain-containing protein n=1 Tax=Trichostrongylus colubriformis TaxID=6319 RepID=A0AAN8IFP1_TRICO